VGSLFNGHWRTLGDDVDPADRADGRLAVDDGRHGNADRLLERLRLVHGEPRYDIAPELERVRVA
jgi:hypothetical protein